MAMFTGKRTEAVVDIQMELREVQGMVRTLLVVEAQRVPEVPLALRARLQVLLELVLLYVECPEVEEVVAGMVAAQASRRAEAAAPVTTRVHWAPAAYAVLTATAMQRLCTKRLRVLVLRSCQLPRRVSHLPWRLPVTQRIAPRKPQPCNQ